MFHDKIRTRVITTHEGTQCVIDDYLKDTSNEMVALLPNFKHIKRNIQRQRKKNDLPQVPQDKHFTMIPTILTITLRKDIFLQFDSGPDGTFKVTPLIFSQLYTIHGVYRSNVFPLIFALLPDKQQQSYQRLIKELRHLCPAWFSKSIMVDFEKGAINAFEEEFNTTANSELGFKNNYETDSKFANNVNKIAALAFLKPTDVHQGFNELYLSLPPMFQPLMDYFEDTYLGRRCPNGRATPRYPIELWNMYQRTIDDSMRTNNLAEVWHRRFNSVDQFQHPSLWIFI
ncbi:unnamed protein product [Rotaria sp. Silwood2]|nr:unnamed protein product [Rotaria sp. Silwood2]CAF4501879.1 unnamed protein product [Rotaria sp. Silwood2]